jgi:putative cell wall-binding protein
MRRTLGGAFIAITTVVAAIAASAAPAGAAAGERIAGTNRYDTAVAFSESFFPNPSLKWVLLATGQSYADALVAGVLGYRSNGTLGTGPTLLIPSCGDLPESVVNEMKRLAPTQGFYAVGGTKAICDQTLNAIRGRTGKRVERVAGVNRYETAVAISKLTFSSGGVTRLFIASGETQDALMAAGFGWPVLLVPPSGTVPSAVINEISRLAPGQVVVLGRTSTISAAVQDRVDRAANLAPGSRDAVRISYDSMGVGVVLSQTFSSDEEVGWDDGRQILLVNGGRWADALAAAGSYQAKFFVSDCAIRTDVLREIQRLHPSSVAAVGGTAAICQKVVDQAVAAANA